MNYWKYTVNCYSNKCSHVQIVSYFEKNNKKKVLNSRYNSRCVKEISEN